jgi:RNA polymerase sigma factor (sigma-70 family)
VFPTTRHTLLRHASAKDEQRGNALNDLIEVYWEPCRRYLTLRFRQSYEDTQDLVQAFFTAAVEQEVLTRYDPGRGPFRPYLRACLDRFALKQLELRRCEKRGGNVTILPIESELAATGEDPEQIFHREWQRGLFSLAAEDLRRLCENTGRAVRYQLFAAYDLGDEPRPRYDDLAAQYGIPVATVTNHLAWARRELRKLVEARVARTAPSDGERHRDLRNLFTGKWV